MNRNSKIKNWFSVICNQTIKASCGLFYNFRLRNSLNWGRKQLFTITLPSSEVCFVPDNFKIDLLNFDSKSNVRVIKRINLLLFWYIYSASYYLTLSFSLQVSILASCGKELKFLPNNSLKSSNFLTDTNLILLLYCTQKSFLGHFGWCDFWLCFKLLMMVKKRGGGDFLMRTALSLIAFPQNQFLPFLFCSCEV